MKLRLHDKLNIWQITLVGTILIIILGGYYGFYKYRLIRDELNLVNAKNAEITTQLKETKGTVTYLFEKNKNQQEIIDSFTGQISNISSTVGDLEKLSQTDPELLKKYSKVYFLNENYVPTKLADIDKKNIYDGTTNFLIHADVWPHLKELLDSARASGIDLLVASAFRSFDTQASLKSSYTVIYGAGTSNQFSADQGYSEHQLGTAVDFITSVIGGEFSKFINDPAYEWLENNAYKYGFILSYPAGNSYYKSEPWHWRFVGVALATDLHEEGKYFYDLDQREIDTYLIKLFD